MDRKGKQAVKRLVDFIAVDWSRMLTSVGITVFVVTICLFIFLDDVPINLLITYLKSAHNSKSLFLSNFAVFLVQCELATLKF
jgi:hypothetical protein